MRPQELPRALPRVLVACTADTLAALGRLLDGLACVVPALSMDEALSALESDIELVVCNLRFADSRMLELVQRISALPPERQPRVLCVRVGGHLSPAAEAALKLALQELGVQGFIDLPAMRAQHGAAVAAEAARRLLMAHLGLHAED